MAALQLREKRGNKNKRQAISHQEEAEKNKTPTLVHLPVAIYTSAPPLLNTRPNSPNKVKQLQRQQQIIHF